MKTSIEGLWDKDEEISKNGSKKTEMENIWAKIKQRSKFWKVRVIEKEKRENGVEVHGKRGSVLVDMGNPGLLPNEG